MTSTISKEGSTLHHVLPVDAQLSLQRAQKTPNTARDPHASAKAIEKAVQRIKAAYPHLFKE